MSRRSKREYLHAIYRRYQQAPPTHKGRILDEFCQVCGYHRKYAIRLLNGPPPGPRPLRRRRCPSRYSPQALAILRAVWAAADYPWSVRLKALVPLWLPWIRQRFGLTPALERQMLAISPRQLDRRLAADKRRVRRRLYGRTKPGTLLKHQIPIKTDHWDVTQPGYAEIDLVSHSGACADGEFAHSLTLTDIHTTWTESYAVLGKGQARVQAALEALRQSLPFALVGLDSDNGSEFVNYHLWAYTQAHGIQFTRGRPYKKDDNAHIEQKNWTHVRKLVGWERYDTAAAVAALNTLYRHDWRLMMNLFQPSVKLVRKVRVGSRLTRVYDAPQTPLDRVAACPQADAIKVVALQQLRARLDPFVLAQRIETQVRRIHRLANRSRPAPTVPKAAVTPAMARRSLAGLHSSMA
jgi:hypothetical protein